MNNPQKTRRANPAAYADTVKLLFDVVSNLQQQMTLVEEMLRQHPRGIHCLPRMNKDGEIILGMANPIKGSKAQQRELRMLSRSDDEVIKHFGNPEIPFNLCMQYVGESLKRMRRKYTLLQRETRYLLEIADSNDSDGRPLSALLKERSEHYNNYSLREVVEELAGIRKSPRKALPTSPAISLPCFLQKIISLADNLPIIEDIYEHICKIGITPETMPINWVWALSLYSLHPSLYPKDPIKGSGHIPLQIKNAIARWEAWTQEREAQHQQRISAIRGSAPDITR